VRVSPVGRVHAGLAHRADRDRQDAGELRAAGIGQVRPRGERLVVGTPIVEVRIRVAGGGGREHRRVPVEGDAPVDRGRGGGGYRRPGDVLRGGAARGPPG